jgi:uncharacterized protein with HEPN domain
MSSKKPRDIELFAVDLFVAIHKIKSYTNTFTNGESLRHNSLHWDATIRELELIGEALNNLLENERFSAAAPSYFRKVINFRNAIVHGYFGIDEEEVWDIVTEKLDLLAEDMTAICKETLNLNEAIESQIVEFEKFNDVKTVEFLKRLKVKV